MGTGACGLYGSEECAKRSDGPLSQDEFHQDDERRRHDADCCPRQYGWFHVCEVKAAHSYPALRIGIRVLPAARMSLGLAISCSISHRALYVFPGGSNRSLYTASDHS